MKRMIIFSVMFILIMNLCSCNDGQETFKKENTQDKITLKIPLHVSEEKAPDIDLIEEELSKMTEEKIGVKTEIVLVGEEISDKEIQYMFAKNEKIDLVFSINSMINFVNNGYIIEISELLEKYGQGIKKAVGSEYLRFGLINGKQYGIPTNRDMASAVGIAMRTDILDKYNIDVSTIKNLDDLDSVFEIVKQNEPDMFCIAPTLATEYDSMSDGVAVLDNMNESSLIVNFAETPSFENSIRKIREWKLKGYMSDTGYNNDKISTKIPLRNMVREGKLFSYMIKYKPGIETQEKLAVKYDMTVITLTAPTMTNSSVRGILWGISSFCEYPEEAMKLLNLMYTDTDIMNLLCWGIEGKHYVKNTDGTIGYPEGINSENVGYLFNKNWQLPNQFIAYVWEGTSLDLWKDMKKFNDEAIKSNALGFTFDSEIVKNEYYSVRSIFSVYEYGFLNGELDIDEALPELQQKLKETGIDKIIIEKQSQFNEWLKNNR